MRSVIYTSGDSLISKGDYQHCRLAPLVVSDYVDIDLWMHREAEALNANPSCVNLFIPLCFGAILSDYLGLRLACHFRTTPGPNQAANIYIYGFEEFAKIKEREFFSILQTKGVELMDYNLYTLKRYSQRDARVLTEHSLTEELKKIQLDLPRHLSDNHGVANIWGMYRLLELEGIHPQSIRTLASRKNNLSNIYFKWLLAKNESKELIDNDVVTVRRNYTQRLSGPTIIGKIDLSKFPSIKGIR